MKTLAKRPGLAIGAALMCLAAAARGAEADAIDARIETLLAQMTLAEKVGQLVLYSDPGDVTGPAPQDETQRRKVEFVKSGLIGSMLNVIGVEDVREIQKIAVEDSRLGIPMLFGYDVIHGHKTAFPIPLAEAASWDLALIEKSARIAAIEASAQGLNWTFAPMVDISRDPRWGRVMEGAGEDPFLGAEIAVVRVRGFQGEDLAAPDTIAATLKHFAAYGFAESGKDYNAADIGTVTLFNVVLPPFRKAIERANARVVMNSFNTLNGVPATGDRWLQRDILKGAWGFDGFIVSDWSSGLEMIAHGFAPDAREAARLAILAGSDVDMESDIYKRYLEGLAADGAAPMEMIDDAVRRVLRVKFELGLFDDPYRYLDAAREKKALSEPAHRELALKIAERSIVLLKNEGEILPLRAHDSIALIGALAADKDTPLGNWRAQAEFGSAVSVREAFEAAGVDFEYEEGAALEVGQANFADEVLVNTSDRSGFDAAVEAAGRADKVVIVLGEDAMQSGEGRSRAHLGFPGVQQDLLEAVCEANQNVILVVMSGRPLVLSWAAENVPAIVQAWHLGHEAGTAITNVLTGAYNPSGKLPMTFPRAGGQIPIYYNHLNTGRPGPREEVFWSHYIDESNAPLYPFGHGLSYTTFSYSRLSVRQRGENIEISVRVRNDGQVAGEETVQLYMRDRTASVSRPVRELKGFRKIELRPGESRRITFSLTKEELGFYNQRGEYVVEPGTFDFFVGGSSAATLTTSLNYRV
ncbi:beta-glucosidase BglX [Amphiplicatus metriothermophilus]|uniref:Beta-D-glucoside glucohydrolase n=1 Tax=Amphiplicatus metriothermophilus TaxID=1519374 RepID=A0A239PQ25_9PROT|nr:beta-glucosidase BglX [Amphiplicatus metriothermophilus]MBB5518474.1 beta-glucosidase [Amphiplicatus metriothermophilus]SNT72365.1 beta-glucosidase [Amphiplicatus metriothermophilus]